MNKIIDKFLGILKTDKNTFLTYILTLLTIYFTVDRLVELLFLIFSGLSVEYWGPLKYTLVLACPVFAFLFCGSSKFSSFRNIKLTFFYLYCISFYIIGISMFTQWLNAIGWLLFFSVPNYVDIVLNFNNLVHPAFTAAALFIPVITIFPFFKYLFVTINDTKLIKDSIMDYTGIDLSVNKTGSGPYSCEMTLFTDTSSGKKIPILEHIRFESILVVGTSGSGKTTMIYEPMIARDLEKKYFFKEVAKEMGFTALKTGIATLNCPYNNDYLNKNFNLNMLRPNPYKEKVYKAYMKKMIYFENGEDITYRNLGLTYIAPDIESINKIKDVAENFDIPIHLIDPDDSSSIGLNPFVHDDPAKIASSISSALRCMYFSAIDIDESFMQNVATQAIENLAVLLKEMYPRLHDGLLPNLEDMLKMLNNFDLIEKMCEILKTDEELAEKYNLQLEYFKTNFYRNAPGRTETQKYVYSATTQIDTLLRYPGVKHILCNRSNNINFDEVLNNGEVTLLCTRRGDLGEKAHKAFGLFFILLMQSSILRRPGNERTRLPHFLYIDEFPTFIAKETDSIFTLYRKYRVGTIISAQNLEQFGPASNSRIRQTILANCTTKIVFGNNTPEDNEWWFKEFGQHREWKWQRDYNQSKTMDTPTGPSYDDTFKGIQYGWKEYYSANKILHLKDKACIIKTKDNKGKNVIGDSKVAFLEEKFKKKANSKSYNFSKFTGGIAEEDSKKEEKPKKFNPQDVSFDDEDDGDINPIVTDSTDSTFLFDNQDAIVFDFKKRKKDE